MYPTLRVELDKELDKRMCLQFLDHRKAGIDFGKGIIRLYPKLKKAKEVTFMQKLKLIEKYVDDFYGDNDLELRKSRELAARNWEKVDNKFFSACDRFFEPHPWPKGEYIGFLSIFNCNPRFLQNKTFQVYWKHPKGFVAVAVHEMLHFLFFDYLEKHNLKNAVSGENLWKLSEVVNFFILSDKLFYGITKDPNPDTYPQLAKLTGELSTFWGKSKTVPNFVKSVINKKVFNEF